MATTQTKTVSTLSAKAFEKYIKKAASYKKAVLKDKDPENLHQMRVNLRRLRTAMQVFAPSIHLPKASSEAQIARISRRLGALRDLDVILNILETQYAPDLPDAERATLAAVFKRLAKQRKRAFKRVKAELNSDRYAKVKTGLIRWSRAPKCTETAQLDIQSVLPDLTLPLISALWLNPGWLVGTKVTRGALKPDTKLDAASVTAIVGDRSGTLHSLRKQVKRVRYQLKFVAEHYGDRLDDDLKRLTDLQDVLGHLQDSLVLENCLQKALPDWQIQLPTLKSLLADMRYRAWKQWQVHQRYYLDPKHRENLRQILCEPGATLKGKSRSTARSKRTQTKAAPNQTSQKTTQKSSRTRSNTAGKRRSTSRQTPQSDKA